MTEPGPTVHQCPHCFTLYDPQYGDPRQDIPAGTAFAELPATYACSTCDAPRHEFAEMQLPVKSWAA